MSIALITGPAVEPVSLYDVKLRLGFSPFEDADQTKSDMLAEELRGYIVAARIEMESELRRPLISQTWQLNIDGFPGVDPRYSGQHFPPIVLPKPPLRSITSVEYIDLNGAWVALPEDTTEGVDAPTYAYRLDPGSETQPAEITYTAYRFWPPTRPLPGNVRVTFVAGYGPTPDDVPANIRTAIKMKVQLYYESDPVQAARLEKTIHNLTKTYINLVA